nr:hypothetical protein CFP56_20396 [Quercus suber]
MTAVVKPAVRVHKRLDVAKVVTFVVIYQVLRIVESPTLCEALRRAFHIFHFAWSLRILHKRALEGSQSHYCTDRISGLSRGNAFFEGDSNPQIERGLQKRSGVLLSQSDLNQCRRLYSSRTDSQVTGNGNVAEFGSYHHNFLMMETDMAAGEAAPHLDNLYNLTAFAGDNLDDHGWGNVEIRTDKILAGVHDQEPIWIHVPRTGISCFRLTSRRGEGVSSVLLALVIVAETMVYDHKLEQPECLFRHTGSSDSISFAHRCRASNARQKEIRVVVGTQRQRILASVMFELTATRICLRRSLARCIAHRKTVSNEGLVMELMLGCSRVDRNMYQAHAPKSSSPADPYWENSKSSTVEALSSASFASWAFVWILPLDYHVSSSVQSTHSTTLNPHRHGVSGPPNESRPLTFPTSHSIPGVVSHLQYSFDTRCCHVKHAYAYAASCFAGGQVVFVKQEWLAAGKSSGVRPTGPKRQSAGGEAWGAALPISRQAPGADFTSMTSHRLPQGRLHSYKAPYCAQRCLIDDRASFTIKPKVGDLQIQDSLFTENRRRCLRPIPECRLQLVPKDSRREYRVHLAPVEELKVPDVLQVGDKDLPNLMVRTLKSNTTSHCRIALKSRWVITMSVLHPISDSPN